MFCFLFWEPVQYYEPTAKYPETNFLPARHVSIAWKHGDAFTYKVLTTLDGKWEDGCELVRNIVKSRVDLEDNVNVELHKRRLEVGQHESNQSKLKSATRTGRKEIPKRIWISDTGKHLKFVFNYILKIMIPLKRRWGLEGRQKTRTRRPNQKINFKTFV